MSDTSDDAEALSNLIPDVNDDAAYGEPWEMEEEIESLLAKVQAQAKDIKMLRGAIEEALSESIPEGRAPCEIRMAAALRGEEPGDE